MIKLKNKKGLLVNLIAVTLVLIVTAFMFIYFNNTNNTVAATNDQIEIRVNKVTTVSIYVFGAGVEFVESTTDYDLYTADVDSNVRLQAVNETRIFEKWDIKGTVVPDVDLTKNIINFDVEETMSDLTISCDRINATASDYGKYMMDRFVITDENDLIALQKILDPSSINTAEGENENDYFALFFKNPDDYATNDQKDILREQLRYGYFLISNNFTVFNSKFTGIGTKDKPFQGIVCGKNNTNSHIFITITDNEKSGESSYGLFKYLGNESLVRNLNVTTSIGINKQSGNSDATIYAGGLAGVMDKSTLIDVKVTSSIGIESNYASSIHAGGLFGMMKSGSGIDSISDVVYDGEDSKWSITSHKENSLIHAGLVAGSTTDSYIKEVDLIVTNQVVDLKNDSVTDKYTTSKLYLGNVFGSYTSSSTKTTIDDIMIMGDNKEELHAVTTNGEAMVGGLIGYVNASNSNAELNVERVYFRVLNGESKYVSSSIKTSDVTNLYAGGLVGKVDGNYFKGTDVFKNRLQQVSDLTVANYLYEGSYKITTIQNGISKAETNGKSISGGLIGKGIIDLAGSDNENRSEIAIASPTSKFTVEAVQSKLSKTNGTLNDKEHACAALIYGSVANTKLNISNINVYTNNTTIKTIRETGSLAMGDLHTGGFIGYASGSTFTNIGLYFNDSTINAESISYELSQGNLTEDTNSAFCGGFAGELFNGSSLENIIFAGYDPVLFDQNPNVVGTTTNLESIQNTKPGNNNYMGENYIGGIVGRIQKASLTNCSFIGSESNTDYIQMSGHQSPDSAFCGGIVGLIRTDGSGNVSNVINCEVKNTDIIGSATNITTIYSNPDIYVGGIIGAAYMHETDVLITISNSRLLNSNVYSLGNEIITTAAGGILGGATWESSIDILDCYVMNSTIKSNTTTTVFTNAALESSAGGIVGAQKGYPSDYNVEISRCAVIDSLVDAEVNGNRTSIKAYAAGILGFMENSTDNTATKNTVIKNCYSNATITANHTSGNNYRSCHGITFGGTCTANQPSFYLSKNVPDHTGTLGYAVGTGPYNITTTASNPYSGIANINGTNKKFAQVQKLYVEILDDTENFVSNNTSGEVLSLKANVAKGATLAHVWINTKANGGSTSDGKVIAPNHEDKEAAAKDGWFILDYVLLYNGSIDSISSEIKKGESIFTDGVKNYKYYYDDSEDVHYVQNVNNSSDKILNNYIENPIVDGVKEYTLKVYDNMLGLNITFDVTHFSSKYTLQFRDSLGNEIGIENFKLNYGQANLELIEKHSTSTTDKYTLTFIPKEDIETDRTFYIYLIAGYNDIPADTHLKINLEANKLVLDGITYADYTQPVNYYENNNLGSSENPYHLTVNSITKIIPIFRKSNDLDPNKVYILESNIEKCSYSIDSETDQYFDIHSNGELKVGSSTDKDGSLNLTYNGVTKTVYFKSVKLINVSYSVVGADVTGLTKTSNSTDFYFEQYIRSNYGGIPTSMIVNIGNTEYDLTNNPAKYPDEISVYKINTLREITNDPITEYDIDAIGYIIKVNTEGVTSDSISIEIDFPIAYTITFKLQCESFNKELPEEELVKKYKIESGTSFKEFFATVVDGKTRKQEIIDWANNAAIFGYVFTGFYLVNEASSIHSYGASFEQLAESSYVVNSSNDFYGRWSYLIELVEASGTHIKTGFNNAFMQEYKGEGFTRAISIPINANQGYVFRVDTDSHYIGKPGIEAYIVTKNNLGEKIMSEVEIEMYQNNSSLYYIRPENITGYLVLMTTVSNSEVIVGEHTSAVTENITPEDGIITFKYIVNHYNDGVNKSYIYNLSNGLNYQTLYKEFVLDFYKESDHSILNLPDSTTITVYYNKYVNGSTTPSTSIVGKYITNNDDRVYLSEFKTLDLETDAFPEITYSSSIGPSESVTEVFYFTITPPNGYSEKVKHEMANYVVECGYVTEKVGYNEPLTYLEGERTKTELANPNDLESVISTSYSYETAKQDKYYHIVPTRETDIEQKTDGSYTFIDNTTYSIYDIILTDTQKFDNFNYISLYDDTRQSLLESTEMSFTIKQLRLTLGYRLGDVVIYGKKKDSATWDETPVAIISVTSAVSQEYIIDFKDNNGEYTYDAYKIDNISTNEIRVYSINVLSASNNVLYEGEISNFVEKSFVDNKHICSLVHNIVGDSRHDGKTFMLSIQLIDASNPDKIIDDIVGDVYIRVNNIGIGINHYVNLNEYRGKAVAYVNLSQIIKDLNVNAINFDIFIPNEYEIYSIQLLEVANEFKPASGEVREAWTTVHIHYYVDGECYCGQVDPDYISPVHEFAEMLVKDFNTYGGNNDTTITKFHVTSNENIKDIWTNRTMLHKYQWFLTYVRDTITAQATLNNALTDSNYLNAIAMLNAMIVGYHPGDIFDTDYTAGSELVRYFIESLINFKSPTQINAPAKYAKFMVDYSASQYRSEFLAEYEKSKVTINIAIYNNHALASGNMSETINILYFCDTSVYTVGDNSLRWQYKILLNKVDDDTYKVVAIDNATASANNVASAAGVTWTHAIATAYTIDIVALYSDLLNKYLLINDDDVATVNSNYTQFIEDFKNQTYAGGFSATITEEPPLRGWVGDPVNATPISILRYYNNSSSIDGQHNKIYLCNTAVVPVYDSNGTLISGNNTLRTQNKVLLQYDSSKQAYLVVAKATGSADVSAKELATNAGVTWTHCIASSAENVTLLANVGQYIIFTNNNGDVLAGDSLEALYKSTTTFSANVYDANQWY